MGCLNLRTGGLPAHLRETKPRGIVGQARPLPRTVEYP